MKKLIAGLCVILASHPGWASNYQQEPELVETMDEHVLKNAWKVWPWEYNTDVSSKFVKAGNIGKDNYSGACSFQGAIVAVVATEIYENGAKFCTRQIQSAGSGQKHWIDFYDFDGAPIKVAKTSTTWVDTGNKFEYKCETFCKPNYFGDKCDQTKGQCLDKTFTLPGTAQYLTQPYYCDATAYITTSTQVTFSQNINSTKDHSNLLVLGVLEAKNHGIIVAPVAINANKYNDSNLYIAGTSSNNDKTSLLCAPGYVYNNDKTDCVPGPVCKLDNLCNGFSANDYKPTTTDLELDGDCYKFKCQSGYKLNSANKCVANNGDGGGGGDTNKYTMPDMFRCWKCISNFKECLSGTVDAQTCTVSN